MNAFILAIIKMLQALKAVVKANESRYTVIPAFSNTFKEVTDLLAEMEVLQLVAVEKTNSTAGAVFALKKKLAIATAAVSKPMKSLANKLKDIVLRDMMTVSQSSLNKLVPSVLVSICQNIFDKATELKTQAKDYNLTDAKLDKLEALLAEYKEQSPDVTKLQGEINTSKRGIDRLQEDALEIVRGQLDPMVASLQDTDPTAVELWMAARHIKKPQTTHTQLLVVVLTQEGSEQVPVPNAPFIATSKGKDYVGTTNEFGEVLFKPLPYGIYVLRCEVPGFQPYLLKDYKVVRGRVNKLEVVLKKVA